MTPPREPSTSIHFVPYLLGVGIALALLCAGMFLWLGRYTDEDVASYHTMLLEGTRSKSQVQKVSSQHSREDLQKDVYIEKPMGTFQFRLKSKDASLLLERVHGSTDVIEAMDDVTCWLQEDLMYRFPDGTVVSTQDASWAARQPEAVAQKATPIQKVVYLEADKATYDYEKETFVADDARLWRYIASGHTLTERVDKKGALISGVADHVTISLGTEGMAFKATGFKATIVLKGVQQ